MSTEKNELAPYSMTVRYWYVCQDTKQPGGGTVFSEPLSAPFDNLQKAEAVFGRIKDQVPEAYICEADRFFNQARPGDAGRMAEFIAKLH